MKKLMTVAGLLALVLSLAFQPVEAGQVTAFAKDSDVTTRLHLIQFVNVSTTAGKIDTVKTVDLRHACQIWNTNGTLATSRMTTPFSIMWSCATANVDTLFIAVDTSHDGVNWVQFLTLTAQLETASNPINIDTMGRFARLRCRTDLSTAAAAGAITYNLIYPTNCP